MPSPARATEVAALVLERSDRFVLRPVRDVHLALARRLLAPVRTLVGGTGPSMSIRVRGREVAAEPEALREAFAEADGHLIVFVHDLLRDDTSWSRGHPERLRRAGVGTPVVLRYDSAAPVAENGRLLAGLLASLCENWPTRVTRISLVGHAMGGVVVRAALNHALADGHQAWTGLVRDVVCLGPPRLGARWEQLARLSAAAGALRPVAVRYAVVDTERWDGPDITAAWGRDRRALAPLPQARHRFVATDAAWSDDALLRHRDVARLLIRWLDASDRSTRALPTG